jgi:hypothetical protein
MQNTIFKQPFFRSLLVLSVTLITVAACVTTAPNGAYNGGGVHFGFGPSCDGIEVADGQNTVEYHTRPDRSTDNYLKIRGRMHLSEASCSGHRDKLSLKTNVSIDFELGRMGRINPNDKATFVVPYAILVADEHQRIVGQSIVNVVAEFQPNQKQSNNFELVNTDISLNLDETIPSRHLYVYLGFVSPSHRSYSTYSNENRHPPIEKLVRKPI